MDIKCKQIVLKSIINKNHLRSIKKSTDTRTTLIPNSRLISIYIQRRPGMIQSKSGIHALEPVGHGTNWSGVVCRWTLGP